MPTSHSIKRHVLFQTAAVLDTVSMTATQEIQKTPKGVEIVKGGGCVCVCVLFCFYVTCCLTRVY